MKIVSHLLYSNHVTEVTNGQKHDLTVSSTISSGLKQREHQSPASPLCEGNAPVSFPPNKSPLM